MSKFIDLINNPLFVFQGKEISLFTFIEVGLILLALQLVLFLLKKGIMHRIKKSNLNQGDVIAVYQIIKYFLIVIVIIMILDTLGISTTILLTSSAALMVGIGLGLQNIFKDILSGLIILFGKVIKVDDIVEVNSIIGKVASVNLRTSKILTRDDVTMIIPNSKFIEDNVVNWTMDMNHVRQILKVGVAYGSNTQLVKDLLIQSATRHEKVLKDPQPFVRFFNFGDNALEMELIFWTDEIFRMEIVKSEIRFEIDQVFRDHNITIPFPQRTVWINSNSEDNEKND